MILFVVSHISPQLGTVHVMLNGAIIVPSAMFTDALGGVDIAHSEYIWVLVDVLLFVAFTYQLCFPPLISMLVCVVFPSLITFFSWLSTNNEYFWMSAVSHLGPNDAPRHWNTALFFSANIALFAGDINGDDGHAGLVLSHFPTNASSDSTASIPRSFVITTFHTRFTSLLPNVLLTEVPPTPPTLMLLHVELLPSSLYITVVV